MDSWVDKAVAIAFVFIVLCFLVMVFAAVYALTTGQMECIS